ncbi:hypothetical protein VCBJG01_3055, partial [Vibrio cholerae BJG-01]|jgi:hypothetical protein
MVAVVV